MNEMIEHVAISLLALEFPGVPVSYFVSIWSQCSEEFQARYTNKATAAIAAMREPTEAMMDNGSMVRGNHQPINSPEDWNNDDDCAGIWRAMIDAALK